MKTHELRYGNGDVVRLEVSDEAVVADWSQPPGESLDDPVAAVVAAVEEPIEFPSLAAATVPGDQIVLAVDREVPQVDAVVAGVVHTLLKGHAKPADICVVYSDDAPPTGALAAANRDSIETERHDPLNRKGLAYLAAAKDGEPIYMNRRLIDADVVIPISAMRSPASLAYSGVFGGLFPTFSDDATQRRFRSTTSDQWIREQEQRNQQAEEAAWLLGVQFTLQIIPGAQGGVLHVLAGHSLAVEKQGQYLVDAAWRLDAPRRAAFVVAAVEGGPEHQTWDNFARALFAASRVAEPEAVIVICTELEVPPGAALQQLSALDFDQRAIEDEDAELADRLSASLLAEIRGRNSVFLLSNLAEEVVEDLGLGYVSCSEEIERLSQQFESCILLGNANHATPTACDG